MTPELRERQREYGRAYEARNREKRREKSRLYREANREACRVRTLADYHAKREKHLATQRAYREANREAMVARTLAWQRANPERARVLKAEVKRKRAARKLAEFVEDVDRATVWRRDDGICGICSRPADPADWHLDHIIALANGGEHSYANVQVAHPSCNLSKGRRG